ncbi:MAG: methyltransferase domain-containing protein [Alphaproteobacteria bacterium]|nr:methyltransferase domain-containing protein [Alphaproteobacteria bacterium]
MFDFFVNVVLFWTFMFLLALQAYNILFHKDVPNIRTAPAIRKKIIDLLKTDFEARKISPYTIVDLGSGNGLFTREIAQALPQARVIGIEITRQSVMWSNWRKRRAKINNLEYRRMDFLLYDFSEADAVVMYLVPRFMNSLGKKLHEEAKSGTLITSNKFSLGDGWVPEETMRIKTLYFHQGELRVYRKA